MSFELVEKTELPEYQCHKRVRAAKIVGINRADCTLELETAAAPQRVTLTYDWFDKHKPEIGGYFVQYADGYSSYSPARAFEEGYTLVE